MSDDRSSAAKVAGDATERGLSARMSRRVFIGRSAGMALSVGGLGSALAACGTSGSSGAAGGGEVVVMAWSVYLTPAVQKRFKEATGITMRAIPADDDQSMFTKLKAGGGSQYDIVFANCGWAPIYRKNKLTDVIDVSKLRAGDDLWPIFKENTSLPYVVAPNQLMLYPNMWSATGMIWNTTASFQPATPYSWNDLWDAPKGKVILHGAHEDFIAMAGLARGVPRDQIYSMKGATLSAAADYLAQLKPFQISPNSDAVTAKAIATKKAVIGFASSLGVAQKANTEFADGKPVARAVVPKEGTLGWVDGPQLVRGAKNADNAMRFLEFWGADAKNQEYLWDQYFFAQCSKVSTERTLKAGGKGARIARSIGADKPELAAKLTFLAPPDDPQAWTAAYDRAIG